jgi:hypothetical protein
MERIKIESTPNNSTCPNFFRRYTGTVSGPRYFPGTQENKKINSNHRIETNVKNIVFWLRIKVGLIRL